MLYGIATCKPLLLLLFYFYLFIFYLKIYQNMGQKLGSNNITKYQKIIHLIFKNSFLKKTTF
jgi:hypothetical protein